MPDDTPTPATKGPPETTPRNSRPAARDKAITDMEGIVATVLRYGVLLSFAIVLLGSIWLFASGRTGYAGLRTTGENALHALTQYRGDHDIATMPTTPGEVFVGAAHGRPYAIIILGLLVLIATPVLRVAVSVVTFAWERDRLYTIITAYVLAILIVSFIIGKGG